MPFRTQLHSYAAAIEIGHRLDGGIIGQQHLAGVEIRIAVAKVTGTFRLDNQGRKQEINLDGAQPIIKSVVAKIGVGHGEAEVSRQRFSQVDIQPTQATAFIDLKEGDRMFTVLRGVDGNKPEDIKCGTHVKVEFEKVNDDVSIPFWRVV